MPELGCPSPLLSPHVPPASSHAPIVVNGRFLTRRVTGVERYATEVLKRFTSEVTTVTPARNFHGVGGHAWEQSLLFLKARKGLLWSPCNTGPLLSTRQVVTIHDVIALDHPEWFDRQFCTLYSFLLPRLTKRVQHLIAVSEFTKKRLVERLGLSSKKITVIPNGVGEEFFPQPPAETLRVRQNLSLPDGPYILSVGSLEPRKNLARLLQAWDSMPTRYDHFTLVVTGAKTSTHRASLLPAISKKVLFTNYVDDRDLPGLYSGASCFVYPSLYEGFGLPILEALACGVPVVASDCTSIPEVTGSSALLVNPLSVGEISEAIQSALDHPTPLIVGAQSQAKRYGWSRCSQATESLLLSLC